MPLDERRARRSQEILDATRALFDARGMRDAQIEDIAGAVGINRAIIYRHFSTKEELFAMTLAGYLDELAQDLREADASKDFPDDRLFAQASAFFEFGRKFPAFVDCAQAFLRYRGPELLRQMSLERLIHLGQSVNSCLENLVRAIEHGNDLGEYDVRDPELLANIMYTQGLGILNLMTFQRTVHELNTGLPSMAALPYDEVIEFALGAIVGMARTRVRAQTTGGGNDRPGADRHPGPQS